MLDTHAGDANHKVSVEILNGLSKTRGNLSETTITEGGGTMKDWWTMDPKWRHVLVFQFNFHVVMCLFKLCYWKLDEKDYFRQLFDKSDLDKFKDIETLLCGFYLIKVLKLSEQSTEQSETRLLWSRREPVVALVCVLHEPRPSRSEIVRSGWACV
jgi:hypothetical protein